jgi:hypothetical protein
MTHFLTPENQFFAKNAILGVKKMHFQAIFSIETPIILGSLGVFRESSKKPRDPNREFN